MGRDVAGLGRVQQRQVERVHAQGLGRHVPGLLDGELGRGVAEAAEGTGRDLVGVDQVGLDFHVGILVAGVVAQGGDPEHAGRLAAVSAIVGYDPELLGLDQSVALEAHLDRDLHRDSWAAAGQELFLAAVQELDRASGFPGQQGADHGVVVVAGFAAESAAHSALDDAHIRFRHT